MHIASLFGNLISPALASSMMSQTGPWPCLLVAIGCLIVGGIIFMFVPETPQHKSNKQSESGGRLNISAQLRDALSMLNSLALILLFLVALTTSPVTLSTLAFLVQFVSKRYEIPIFATGYVQTGYGIANMIFALGVVPYISRLALTNERLKRILRASNERGRDLALAKWSFGFLIVAAIILGLAPNLAVFCVGLFFMAVGSGYSSFTRSLISFHIKTELRSRAFALVGMVEVLGNIYSQPMLAGLFSLGLDLGGEWIGLPYLGLALLLVFSLLLLSFVSVSDLEEGVARPQSSRDVETQT
jgi:MFS family permease